MTEHFCSKRQAISAVSPLKMEPNSQDSRDQVAERLYVIRCRIAHTKQDGRDFGVDLLLPTSREAASLSDDIELLQKLAQWALVERAVPLRL